MFSSTPLSTNLGQSGFQAQLPVPTLGVYRSLKRIHMDRGQASSPMSSQELWDGSLNSKESISYHIHILGRILISAKRHQVSHQVLFRWSLFDFIYIEFVNMFWFYSYISIRHLYQDYVNIFLPNIIIKIIYVSTRWSMRSLSSFRQESVHY